MCACMEVIVKNSGVTIREVIGGVLGNRFRLCTIQSPTRSVSDLGALVEAIFPVLLIPIAANIVHGFKELGVEKLVLCRAFFKRSFAHALPFGCVA